MKLIYIRFGELPKDGKSIIHRGDEVIGQEKGVSVYEALDRDGLINIIMPNIDPSSCVSLSGCRDRPAFIVEGELIGKGSDGEPLLKNVKIIKQVKL